MILLQIEFWECRKIDKLHFKFSLKKVILKFSNKITVTFYNVEQAFWSLRNIIGWQVIAIYNQKLLKFLEI